MQTLQIYSIRIKANRAGGMIRPVSRDTAQAKAVISSIFLLKRSPVFLEKTYAFRFDLEDDSIPQMNITLEKLGEWP